MPKLPSYQGSVSQSVTLPVIASGRTLFDIIRDRLGAGLAVIPLVATVVVNTLTLVIELAGMTLALELATRVSYLLWFPLAALFLGLILWRASFDLLENGSGAFRQRKVYEANRDFTELLREIVTASAP